MTFDYRKESHPWGIEPLDELKQFATQLKSGTVLDLGGGDGRNSLYLAHLGFSVTNVDRSPAAIASFLERAEAESMRDLCTGIVSEVGSFSFQSYDMILAINIIHFLSPNLFPELFHQIKESTRPGGVVIIADYLDGGPFRNPEYDQYWLQSGELKSLYRDWHILEYKEVMRIPRKINSDGAPMENMWALLVARKPE
ncbi:MAG TPA: methyltransferase domain-containing protein [Patescibacteria group bacterium]